MVNDGVEELSVTEPGIGLTKETQMDLDVFTSLEFKQLLNEPNSQTSKQGLLRFIKASECFDASAEGSHDIVKSYISSSPDCSEILQCLRGQSSPGEIGSVFHCLNIILSRTASDLKELYGKIGKTLCDTLLQSHLQKVYHALGLHQSPRTVANTLKLLTLLVLQGIDNARDVSNQVDFNMRCFKDILSRFKGKLAYEIRLSYIRFALSFFMSDDSKTIQKILETRGFVSAIFEGLSKDTASTVQLVLTTLKEKAVINGYVSKTSRARFFAEPKLLKNLSKLFQWDGVFDIDMKDEMEFSGKEFVRNAVYEFFYHSTCPFKYGINFLDKSIGIGETCKNHVLLDFSLHLLPSTTDPLIQKLVIEILKACPDLLPRFMKDFRMSLEPRNDDIWDRNYELVRKVYENQPDVAPALTLVLSKIQNRHEQQTEKVDPDTLLKMTLPGLFPPNFSCLPVLKHCMKSKSAQMKLKSLNLLLVFMEKVKSSIEFIAKSENWEKSLYSEEEIEIFSAKLEDHLLENHISIPYIVQIWKEHASKNIDSIKAVLLKVLTLCQKLFPEEIQDTKFDFTRLLDGLKFQTITSDASCENIELLIVEMLCEAPQLYKWFKVFEGNTPFKILLKLIYNCPKSHEDFYKKAVHLLQEILVCSGILHQYEAIEAEVWIRHLVPKVRTQNDHVVLDYLTNVCGKIARMPMKYYEILTGQKHGSVANVDQNFWDSLPDVNIESASEKEWMRCTAKQSSYADSLETDSSERHSCISLLSVAALDCLKESTSLLGEAKRAVSEYLTNVYERLYSTMKNTEDAAFFSRIFETCTADIAEFQSDYYSLHNFGVFLTTWSKGKSIGTYYKSNDTITKLMQNWLWMMIKGNKTSKKPILHEIVTSWFASGHQEVEEVGLAISQCLLYFDTIFKTYTADAPSSACGELLASIVFLQEKLNEMTPENSDTSKRKSNSNQNADIWKKILENPSFQTLFFSDIYLECDSKSISFYPDIKDAAKGDASLSTLCTGIVSDLVLKKSWNDSSHENCIKVYTSKIVQSVSSLLEDLTNCRRSFDEKSLLLLKVLESMLSFFSEHELRSIFVATTSVFSQIKSKPVASIVIKLACVAVEGLERHALIDTATIHKCVQLIFKFFESKFMKKSDSLVVAMTSLLSRVPSLAIAGTDTTVKCLMKNISFARATFLSELIQKNPVLLTHCIESDCLCSVKRDKKILFIPLVNHILNSLLKNFSHDRSLDIQNIIDAYWPLLSMTERWEEISSVLKSEVGAKFLENLFLAVASHGKANDILQLLDNLVKKDTDLFKLAKPWSFIEASLVALGNTKYKSGAQVSAILLLQRLISNPPIDVDFASVFRLLKIILTNLDSTDFRAVTKAVSPTWLKFLKETLKHHFERLESVQCIIELVRVQYTDDGSLCGVSDRTNIDIIKKMLVSHSKFLPSIIRAGHSSGEASLKTAVLELHYEIASRCEKEDLSENDLTYLLGAYGCTLSSSDQMIIRTILAYERKGVALVGLKPFLWGTEAISSYRARKNLGENLWKKPGSTEVLSCIDAQVMDATLSRFPIRRRMLCVESDLADYTYFENDRYGTISALKNEILSANGSSQTVYDPCFLLPSFLDLLNPENLVDCKAFVRSGAVSFLMCSLASHCPMVRSLAANCLSLYYQHAQTAWFPENNLIMYLIRCVRNSIGTKDTKDGQTGIVKLPSVVANFLATIVKLHSTPADHMFSVLHRFLLVKPELDLKNIPEFYVLFFSAEMESKIERTWVLNLVSQAFRDMGDYHTVNRRNTIQLLLCLHDSPISDNYVRRQIFEILEQACSIRSAAVDLVKNHGFVSWLATAATNQLFQASGYSKIVQTVGSPGKRQENTVHIIRVLSTLWESLDISRFVTEEKMEVDNDDQEDDTDDLKQEKRAAPVPFRIVKQIISLSVALMENLLSNCKNFGIFESDFCDEALSVLKSCLSDLRNRNKALSKKHDIGQTKVTYEDVLLDSESIRTLLAVAYELLKSGSTKAVRCVIEVFTFWTASDSSLDDERCNLWKQTLECVLGRSVIHWSKDKGWIQENLLDLITWLGKWVKMLKFCWSSREEVVLVKLYDVICCNHDILAGDYLNCVSVLNEILSAGTESDHNTEADLLKQMNDIRLGILFPGIK